MNLPKDFMLGAATAAHQVEGNNIHSDFWAMEQLPHSSFAEPSLDAVDHYNRYKEDVLLMKHAGLNAYRFSIEWARIQPEKDTFDAAEIKHYREMLTFCRDNGIEPIVTLHHFSSPKWLISEGGWEAESTIGYFKDYTAYVARELGDVLSYVCTINEANMGLQMAAIARRYMKQMGIDSGEPATSAAVKSKQDMESSVQVGMNLESMMAGMTETAAAFGLNDPQGVHTFLSQRSAEGDLLIMRAHEAARDAMKEICPHLRVGVTLSLHDIQALPGGEEVAAREWEEEFLHYLPYLQKDDFFGLQNYTRERMAADGIQPAPQEAELTQMKYEFYPQALEHVIRRVAQALPCPIIVTESGIATSDDTRRVAFIEQALAGVKRCIVDGLPVKGYMYWSLLDNFEWQKGFGMTFGLIAVDRSTQARRVKPSLEFLGNQR